MRLSIGRMHLHPRARGYLHLWLLQRWLEENEPLFFVEVLNACGWGNNKQLVFMMRSTW